MKLTIDITPQQWEVLKPILKDMIVPEEVLEGRKRIDFDAIMKLESGARIVNVLRDDKWYNAKNDEFCSLSYEDELNALTQQKFCRHRNAGAKSWRVLKAYIETIK